MSIEHATGVEVVVAVKVIPPYDLEVTFDDGVVRRLTLAPNTRGPAFESLRDPARFAEAMVDEEAGTVAWPNGVDIAPEFLYEAGVQVSP